MSDGFKAWYARHAKKWGLNPDPDSQPYDYRAAWRAGAGPDKQGHWPSRFKLKGHPTEVVGRVNVRTGTPIKKVLAQIGGPLGRP
jgi:hypothetical protein